jgi:hypothetical protein
MAYFTLYENGTITIASDHERKIPDKINGNKTKSYFIDSKEYRKIASSAVNLWRLRVNKLTFFTLTFPFDANEVQANECFSKFVENLKLNYELKNYIAVKERGEQFNRLHFHAIFDIKWTDIKKINSAWCATFRNWCAPSVNAVRLPSAKNGGAVIKSQKRCVKYICKYLGKQKDREVFERPCVFISRQILSRPTRVNLEFLEQLKKDNYFVAFTSEYTTTIQFYKDKDKKEQAFIDFLQ